MLLVLLSVWTIPQLEWQVWADMFPNMREIIRCESNFKVKAFNAKDTDGRSKFGILQIGRREFNAWSKAAGIKNPNIWNPMHQIVVFRWAEENDLIGRWGCYHTLLKKGQIFID